jgi:hypothetical protein
MALLGVPFKLVYWAKNAKTGLTSISAKIMRSDGLVIGPLIMTEVVSDSSFSGSYSATYSPGVNDPEGNYTFVISSPNENGHKAFKTEYFEKRADIDVSGLDIAINRRQAIEAETVSLSKTVGYVEGESVAVSFESGSSVEAYFYKDDLEKFLDNNQIIGETE